MNTDTAARSQIDPYLIDTKIQEARRLRAEEMARMVRAIGDLLRRTPRADKQSALSRA
ncbi:MAG: hypothetical protein AAGC57_05465 [Pseudomonadota bacterium]